MATYTFTDRLSLRRKKASRRDGAQAVSNLCSNERPRR
jgi:hypothetical protein